MLLGTVTAASNNNYSGSRCFLMNIDESHLLPSIVLV